MVWSLLLTVLLIAPTCLRVHRSSAAVVVVAGAEDDAEEERCHVEPSAYYGEEQVEKLLSKGKALEVRGRTARAMECYVLAATTSSVLSHERALSSLLLLAKLEATITTTTTSKSRTWEVLRELVYNNRIPPEVLGIPRHRSRIGKAVSSQRTHKQRIEFKSTTTGNAKTAKAEEERMECRPLVQPMMQQQRLASSYKLIGSIYEELKCHWEASNFYNVIFG